MTALIVNLQQTPLGKTLGVAKFTLNLAEALAAHHRIIVLCLAEDVARVKAIDGAASWTIIKVGPTATTIADPAGDAAAVELRAHQFQPSLTGRKSITILYDFHTFTVPWKYKDPEAMQRLVRDSVSSADAVVTMFPHTYSHYARYTGLPTNRLFLTGSPLLLKMDGRRPTPLSQRIAAMPGHRLFYPAQFQAHKNHVNLFRALTILNRRQPVTLLLSGTTYAPEQDALIKSEAARSGLGDRIVNLGQLTDDEVVSAYASVDATVVPSLAEGGAYVPLEALTVGCPVAVSDIASTREHLRSVGALSDVVFFDPADPDEIAGAIAPLLAAPRLAGYRGPAPRPPLLPGWSDIARDWSRIVTWLAGASPRPFTQIDAAYRVHPLSG